MWFLNKSLAYNRSILEHILKIDQITVMHVLCIVVRIMEMYYSLLIRLHNLSRKKKPSCDILAHLSCHVISLNTVYSRILVGVLLLNLFIIIFNQ